MSELRVGVSGWNYDHWRNGGFYPQNLPRNRELEYITRHFNSAEINGSFYSLLNPGTYEKYRNSAPEGFLYAVKGSRFITHSKKLKDVRIPLANFLASGVLRLEEKLGPFLWQFPQMEWPIERVEEFLDLLPSDTQAAGRLAKQHDERVTGRASMVVHESQPIRHALEFRHPHFLTEQVVRLCRERQVALVISDSGGAWPLVEEVTTDFTYLRLHGSPQVYASPYDDAQLHYWAQRIQSWERGDEPQDARRITELGPPGRGKRGVYAYFDNDQHAHAPRNALQLMELLGIEIGATGPA
ncbi:MAG: DUF72 domain-containing protein [Thiogranum sp.]|nr:DUF72 domain-containing protein [Thiogranum sp.]